MPTTEELINIWSPRFEALDISKEKVVQALSCKPENASVDLLYKNCQAFSVHTAWKNFTPLHLALYSGDLNWIKQVLQQNVIVKIDANNLSIAHHVALSGYKEGLFAVLAQYPEIEYAQDCNLQSIVHSAAISGNMECLFAVIDKYPDMLNLRNKHQATVAVCVAHSRNGESLFQFLKKYQKFIDEKLISYAKQMGINFDHLNRRLGMPSYQECVRSGSVGWEKALIELKKLTALYPDVQENYKQGALYHVARLKRLLKNDQKDENLKTLEMLAENEIDEAKAALNEYRAEIALNTALQLMALPAPTSGFFGNNHARTERNKEIQKHLEKARDANMIVAHFHLGEWYCKGPANIVSFAKGCRCYYEGAMLGEAKAKNALKIASHETSELGFWGLLYQGLYEQKAADLIEAQKRDEKTFAAHALSFADDNKLTIISRVMLLKLLLEKQPDDDSVKRILFKVIKTGLQTLKNEEDQMSFVSELNHKLGGVLYTHYVIWLADELAISQAHRVALLTLTSTLLLTAGERQIIEAHLSVVPETVCAKYKALLPVKAESTTQTTSQTSSDNAGTEMNIRAVMQQEIEKLQGGLKKEEVLLILEWLLQYPFDESDNATHKTVSRMRSMLLTTDCELYYYVTAPQKMSPSISSVLQEANARAFLLTLISEAHSHLCQQPQTQVSAVSSSRFVSQMAHPVVTPEPVFPRAPSSEFFEPEPKAPEFPQVSVEALKEDENRIALAE